MFLLGAAAVTGAPALEPMWLIPPATFVANDVKQSFRIPSRTWHDVVMAAVLVPQELFALMRAAWFGMSRSRVLSGPLNRLGVGAGRSGGTGVSGIWGQTPNSTHL